MKVSNLGRGEYLAMLGGAVLGLSIFVPKTYEARAGTNASIAGCSGCVVSVFQAHPIMGWLLLAAAIAPFILAWIILREHELSWPRGQVTSVVAIAAAGLLFYNGIVDRPGETVRSEIELDWAWYTALGGSLAMLLGSFLRIAETETKRKPPGVL